MATKFTCSAAMCKEPTPPTGAVSSKPNGVIGSSHRSHLSGPVLRLAVGDLWQFNILTMKWTWVTGDGTLDTYVSIPPLQPLAPVPLLLSVDSEPARCSQSSLTTPAPPATQAGTLAITTAVRAQPNLLLVLIGMALTRMALALRIDRTCCTWWVATAAAAL